MNTESKAYIICPECQSITNLTFDGLTFKSTCPLNHIIKNERINIFLSKKVNNEEFNCSKHNGPYNQYCKKCNKNICLECYENHEDHEEDLLDLSKIILPKEYKEYSIKLKTIIEYKNSNEKPFNKISKLKEIINELNKNINEIYDKAEIINNKLINLYSFNKAILDSYKNNKLNYNTILNVKNFYFNENEVNQFNKSIDLENVTKLIQKINEIAKEDISSNLLNSGNSMNTFVSINYCPNWGMSEAIREILQNQIHEIVTQIGGKDKLIVENIGEEFELYDKFIDSFIKKKLNFIFKKKDFNKIYGEIKYDKDKKEIRISNIGNLETGDLLFGCLKNIGNRKDIIGKFGEGMKIAALTFIRLNKKFIIKSNGKIWTFFYRKYDKFIKNKEVQTCLFWNEEKDLEYCENSSNNSVEIVISEFSPEQWFEETDKYLWLSNRETGRIAAYDGDGPSKEFIGDILLGKFFKKKIYVKDSYIETTNDFSDCSNKFGFNLDLELDRDRKCIISTSDRNKCIRKIIAYILNNFKKIRKTLNKEDSKLLDRFPKTVYYCLNNNFGFLEELHTDIKAEGVDCLWDYLIKKDRSYQYK